MYKLTGHTFVKAYIGQTEWNLNTRYKENCRYIKINNPKSAFALYISKNKHEYEPLPTTIKLIKSCNKSKMLNCWEIYIQSFHQQTKLMAVQNVYDYTIYSIAQTDSAEEARNYINSCLHTRLASGNWHNGPGNKHNITETYTIKSK
jgi:hypothetical protein